MQRLHEADLVRHLLERNVWVHLFFPAIAECGEAFHYQSILGRQTSEQRVGDILNPERGSKETRIANPVDDR